MGCFVAQHQLMLSGRFRISLAYNTLGLSVSHSSSDKINGTYELAIFLCLRAFFCSFAPNEDMRSTKRGGDFCVVRKHEKNFTSFLVGM